MKHGEHHGHGRHGPLHRGAQTFRRGKAVDFLQRLDVKRETLRRQLAQPEFAPVHPVIGGELKAIEMVRDEFVELFGLHEGEAGDVGGEAGDA